KSRQSIVFLVTFGVLSFVRSTRNVARARHEAHPRNLGLFGGEQDLLCLDMDSSRAALRAQHEIVRLCHAGLDPTRLRREVMDQVLRSCPPMRGAFPPRTRRRS